MYKSSLHHLTGYETTRLRVQEWFSLLDDPAKREALRSDLRDLLTPAVLALLPDSFALTKGPDAIDRWIDERSIESSVYTVSPQDAPDLLGLLIVVGFSDDQGHDTVHIGYLLNERIWRQGFASELVTGFVNWSIAHLRNTTLVGGVIKGNAGSVRVLEKAGFTRVAESSDDINDVFQLDIP